MILLCDEFAQLTPKDMPPQDWLTRLKSISDALTITCRAVDPQSTMSCSKNSPGRLMNAPYTGH
jgi:hypothetical protein